MNTADIKAIRTDVTNNTTAIASVSKQVAGNTATSQMFLLR